ncbi:MAG: glycosyltransferase [Oscillospiraceae bacterium]|jgi:glycosyltransferase involved in cell wall biosynthesis|nr:glycosyltransferase [Oscillospiraceae bacterium]
MKKLIVLPNTPRSPSPTRVRHLLNAMPEREALYFERINRRDMLSEDAARPGLTIKTLPDARLFRSARHAAFVRKTARALRFTDPVLWVCSPLHAETARRIPRSALIFDASEGYHEKLAAAADVILVSTAVQEARAKLSGKPVRLLPNGVSFSMYHEAAERNLPFPDDLFNVRNPIIGHLGALDRDVDLGYIEAAAKARPDWSFVFVGAVSGADVTPLKDLPNVFLLGHKPHKTLPVYVSRFDVCVNVTKNVDASPMKLYAYLATGKPVVSTPHPAQALDYTEALYIAATHEEFIALCQKALRERDAWRVRRRIEYGRAASWEARVLELERLMKELSVF